MTNPNQQANTLGILLWIYAGVQSLFALFILLIIALYGVSGVMMAVSGGSDAAAGVGIMAVVVIIYGVILAIGVTSIVLNIKAGGGLKRTEPASKNLLLASSIGNILSWFCGGICLAPFGIAMGVYGLWFTLSDVGSAYFQSRGINTPPRIDQYDLGRGPYNP